MSNDDYRFKLFEMVETEIAGPQWIPAEVVDRYCVKTAEDVWVPVYVLAPPDHGKHGIVETLAFVVGEGEMRPGADANKG